MDAVVVGELNADLILTGLAGLPALGELRLAREMRFTLGSSSAIFACNLARLGAKVGFVGKVGEDMVGDFLLERLRAGNVDTSRILRSKSEQTGVCVILSFPQEYAMASYPGVRETFCLADIDLEYVRQAKHLHMSTFYLQPALQADAREVFRTAKTAGLTTSLDPDTDPTQKWAGGLKQVLPFVDIFLPNEQEAMKISGQPDVHGALEDLTRSSNTVVIKRGAAGVMTEYQGRAVTVRAFSVNPVDTTGAGDSFNAGFIFRRLQNQPLSECIAWGNACAAMSTLSLGGTEGFPSCESVTQFFSEHAEELAEMNKAFFSN